MAKIASCVSPSIPCRYCKRKFGTLQALGAHQKAHMLKHAMAKRKQYPSRARTGQSQARAIGMCACCMRTSPLGNRFTSTIEQAYLLRIQQLAGLKQLQDRIVASAGTGGPFAGCGSGEPEIIDLETMSDRPMASPSPEREVLDLISLLAKNVPVSK